MREIKRLFVAALLLTFIGGVGTGAYLGGLRASTPAPLGAQDRRVSDWTRVFDLSASQLRRLRDVFLRHDHGVQQIREEIQSEQFLRMEQLRQRCRTEIREEILTEEQGAEYDRLRSGG